MSDIYKNLKNGLDNSDVAKITSARNSIHDVIDKVATKPFGANVQPYGDVRFSDSFGMGLYNNTNVFLNINKGQLVDGILGVPIPINLSDPYTQAQIQNAIDNIYNAIYDTVVALPGGTDLLNGNIDLETFLAGLSPADAKTVKKQVAYDLYDYLPSVEAIAYSDTVLTGTYALNPIEDLPQLAAGANVRIVNRRITIQALSPLDINSETTKNILREIQKSSTRLGADLGFTYSWEHPYNLRAGLMLQEVIHGKGIIKGEGENSLLNYFSPTDPAPFTVNTGISWGPSDKWRLNLDLYDAFNKTVLYGTENYFSHVNAGAQYSLLPWLGLRGGVNYRLLTGGFGLMFRHFNLDYAFAPNIFGVYSHFIQFRLLFGRSTETSDYHIRHEETHTPTYSQPRESLTEDTTNPEPTTTDFNAENPISPKPAINTTRKSYQEYLESADNLIARKEYKNAALEYGRAIAALPAGDSRRVYTYEQQGQMYLKGNNLGKAKEAFLGAIVTGKKLKASNKTLINSYLGLAYCFEKTGNSEAAIKNYEKALSMSPSQQTKTRIQGILRKLKAKSNK